MNRPKIAVFGLLTIVVLSVLNLLLDIPPLILPDIRNFDSHVALARPSLPRTGTIGYYTDYVDPSGGRNTLREYYLMQYAVAPVVVAQGIDQPLVITSLHNPHNPLPFRNLVPVQDFGSGIKILRNLAK